MPFLPSPFLLNPKDTRWAHSIPKCIGGIGFTHLAQLATTYVSAKMVSICWDINEQQFAFQISVDPNEEADWMSRQRLIYDPYGGTKFWDISWAHISNMSWGEFEHVLRYAVQKANYFLCGAYLLHIDAREVPKCLLEQPTD